MPSTSGRLFVAHGRIEFLTHDAAIIPTDEDFRLESYWNDLIGTTPSKPTGYDDRGWARVPEAPSRVWALSIGGLAPDPYDVILERVSDVLRDISDHRGEFELLRGEGSLPLVALPVIGIGAGGFSEDKGTVLQKLVEHLQKAAVSANVDVALVTPDSAVYGAAQHVRRSVAPALAAPYEQVAQRLGNEAAAGDLALLTGAGVSIPAGLRSWHGLLQDLAETFEVTEASAETLTATDQAELISRAAKGAFQDEVVRIVDGAHRPSLLHALLAGVDCREVVTTNYDLLYEDAVEATGRTITSVMPWASAHGAERWVLKLHGDINNAKAIVLTRRHMVLYDAANRPSASVLQSLLLTRRVLIVGASMSDDNVVRLLHEVQAYRKEHQGDGAEPFGTCLDVEGSSVRSRLWQDELEWIKLPEIGPWSGPRACEIFLDRMAMHASRDSSWLLDPRFAGMLTEEERHLSDQARELHRSLAGHNGDKWQSLVAGLERLGSPQQD